MSPTWLILADDLTGAADCGVAFAKRGIDSKVVWSEQGVPGGVPFVLSYDLRCRGAPSSDAAAKHRDVIGHHLGSQTNLFKKIDSTLRGQPAAEVAAAMDGLRARAGDAFGILAPAFPATGRTTLGGRVHVDGVPLEATPVWQFDRSYPSADLAEVLATENIASEKVSLETVREEGALRAALTRIAARRNTVAVCDAVTQDDLARIAASASANDAKLFIGSAGLADALADALPRHRRDTSEIISSSRGLLVVVGSLSEVSKSAARRFAARPNVRYFPVAPDFLLSETAGEKRAALAGDIVDALEDNDVLVELFRDEADRAVPDRSIGRTLAAALADMLKPAAARMSALAATGGETAAALLDRFDVDAIRLIDEVESGVCLGMTQGAVSLPIVTKSGAFGDEDTLIRIAAQLRQIRELGSIE